MTILEQLWYETLHPAEITKKQNPEYSKLTNIMGESEIKLLHLLTDEGKELFHKYADARTDLNDMDECDIFINGFRIGARIMLEIMEVTDVPPVKN